MDCTQIKFECLTMNVFENGKKAYASNTDTQCQNITDYSNLEFS